MVGTEDGGTPLEDLGLCKRTYHSLARSGYRTVEELQGAQDSELLAVQNFGVKSLAEVKERLRLWQQNASIDSSLDLHSGERTSLEEVEGPDSTENGNELQAPLGVLDLPAWVHNALLRSGIITVAAAVEYINSKDRYIVRSLGKKGQQILEASLRARGSELQKYYLSHQNERPGITEKSIADQYLDYHQSVSGGDDPHWEPWHSQITELTLQAWWDWLTSLLRDRERIVLFNRFGLETGEVQTLELVASRLDVTRERVRQIETKALRLLHKKANLFKATRWQQWLSNKILDAGNIASTAEIGNWIVEAGVEPSGISPVGFARFVTSLCPGIYQIKKDLFTLDDAPPLAPVLQLVTKILADNWTSMTWEELWSQFQGTWSGEGCPQECFVKAAMRLSEDIVENPDGTWGLKKWRRGITDEIVAALRTLGRPAHYSEIAQMIGEKPKRVHAVLSRKTDIFAWVGLRGTFGLIKWGLQQAPYYVDALTLILKQAGHPLTSDEILARLPAIRPYYEESSVILTLGTNSRFRIFPDETYGLSEWTSQEAADEGYRLKRLFESVESAASVTRPKQDLQRALNSVDDFFAQLTRKQTE